MEKDEIWVRDRMAPDERPGTRTWVIPALVDEHGQPVEYDRERALALMQDLEAVLFTVGGMVALTVERVRTGTAPGGAGTVASISLIAQWQQHVPVRRPPEEAPHRAEAAAAVEEPEPDPVAA